MENYSDILERLSGKVISRINYLVSIEEVVKLNIPRYITYICGFNSVTYTCTQVWKDKYGKLFFDVLDLDDNPASPLTEEEIKLIDCHSLCCVLDELDNSVRHDMLIEIRDIAKAYGGKLTFCGEHLFQIEEQGNAFCNLTAIYIKDGDSELVIEDTFEGDNYSNSFSEVGLMDLKLLLDYAREFKKKKFRVWVRGSFSRDFEIEAGSEEEALKLANEEWQNNPLCPVDSNGEDWNVNKC